MPAALFLQVVAEEGAHSVLSVFCVGGAIAGRVLVVGIFEGVSGVGIDFYVDGVSDGLHGGSEFVDVLRGDSFVERAEVAEDGGVNLLKGGGVGGERAVVDSNGAETGVGDCKLGCEASAHAPADGADAGGVDGLEGFEVIGGGEEIAHTAVLGKSAHELVGGFRIVGGFAAIEIDGERYVSLAGEIGGLLLDPVIQSPPFMDDDDGGMRAGSGGRIEERVRGLISAGEGDLRGLRGGEERRSGEQKAEGEREMLYIVHVRKILPVNSGCQARGGAN